MNIKEYENYMQEPDNYKNKFWWLLFVIPFLFHQESIIIVFNYLNAFFHLKLNPSPSYLKGFVDLTDATFQLNAIILGVAILLNFFLVRLVVKSRKSENIYKFLSAIFLYIFVNFILWGFVTIIKTPGPPMA